MTLRPEMDSPEKKLTLDFIVSYLRGRNPVNPYEPTTGQSVQASMEPRKIEPMPPEPLPVNPPNLGLPHDGTNESEYLMKERFDNWRKTTILRSRTIVTVVVSVLGFVLAKFLGLDVDLGVVVEAADGLQLGELVLAIGAVIAAYFRKNARADLSKPSQG